MEPNVKQFKLDCPRFDDMDFRRWWAKLKQFFEAEGVGDHAKVRMDMLHLEEKALD